MEQREDFNKDLIFSLDIGTRTIIGIVGNYTADEKFNILAYSVKEHRKRYMYDGQIHDIEGVTKIVVEIKDELEKKIGVKLTKASIAAAGRSLKTCKTQLIREIDNDSEIRRSMIEILELEAVQKAQMIVNTEEKRNGIKYYNIGYTVINYYLDNAIINKLEGHRGERIGVNLLATFLPQTVIEGLYSVISKSGLMVDNITLEPIAAINVAIKEELRLLNLALVDIGAGTSDIAITRDGKIIAYAMTSLAGDEITEAISKKYLLDFNAGEKLKIKLKSKDIHEFIDIVGGRSRLTTDEIIGSIQDTISKITDGIVAKIVEYNDKAPSAVFLIGGSSQMPGLKESIANKLGLPKERVSIRDTSFIENVKGLGPDINGPDIVTPIGIAIEAATQKYKNFIEIEFNGEKVRIFNSEEIKVSDILILNSYNPKDLIPRPGDDFTYFLNNKKITVSGEEGNPAIIYVDNKKGNLNTKLMDGSIIRIKEATKGRKASPYLMECVNTDAVVYYNDEPISLIKEIRLNGNITKNNPLLHDGDSIETLEIKNMQELLKHIGKPLDISDVLLNGRETHYEDLLQQNDKISTIEKKTITLTINGKQKTIKYSKDKFIFVDIFEYIDFDLTTPKGKLFLKLNNKDAEYMEPLRDGDRIEIYWCR